MSKTFLKIATLTASLAMMSCNVKINKKENFELGELLKPKTVVEQTVNVEKTQQVQTENSDETFERAIRRDIEKIHTILKEEPENLPVVLKSIWKDEYSKGSHRNSIEEALGRALWNKGIEQAVKGFSEGIEMQIKKHNVKISGSEREQLMQLVLLAIPESHWDNLKSHASAKGTYQFIKSTAKSYDLISKGVDKRGDVYESSKAAGRLLFDNYIIFGRNMELALATYNSGKPWTYRKEEIQNNNKSKISYERYLKYLAKEIEKDIKEANSGKVVVAKGDNINKILKRAGVIPTQSAIDVFCAHNNNIKPKQLIPGKKLNIPQALMSDTKVNVSNMLANNIVENVNYPPKFYAVIDLVSDKYPEVLDYINGKISFDSLNEKSVAKGIKVTPMKEFVVAKKVSDDKTYVHVVKNGENVSTILRSNNVLPTWENIKQLNCGKCNKIKVGDKLNIPRKLLNQPKNKSNKNKVKN